MRNGDRKSEPSFLRDKISLEPVDVDITQKRERRLVRAHFISAYSMHISESNTISNPKFQLLLNLALNDTLIQMKASLEARNSRNLFRPNEGERVTTDVTNCVDAWKMDGPSPETILCIVQGWTKSWSRGCENPTSF